MNNAFLSLVIGLLFTLTSCGSQTNSGLKIAATPTPHAQMLEFIKPQLKDQGINLIILVTDDYNMPNRALADHEIDANFFQHLPFLEEQIRQFDYPLIMLAKVELEPMAIYSKKIKTLSELKEKAIFAIPNDPTNEARALLMLQKEGLIELDDSNNLRATILNISKNPKHFQFIEIDAAMLPRTLEDVDVAVINTNYALEANLSPQKEALVLENSESVYANIIAIRKEDENRADIQALKKALTSEKMRTFILETYQKAVIPSF